MVRQARECPTQSVANEVTCVGRRVLAWEPFKYRERKLILWVSIPIEIRVRARGARQIIVSAKRINWTLEEPKADKSVLIRNR